MCIRDSSGRVKVYSLGSGNVIADLDVASIPGDVAISEDGQLAVVDHGQGTFRLTVIDLMTLSVRDEFATVDDLTTRRVQVTPDKSHAIVGAVNDVHFVDLLTGATTAVIPTGIVGDIELSFDGSHAFVGNVNARLIEIASQSVVDTFSFDPTFEIATSPVALEAVGLNNRFREEVHFYDIDPSAGSFIGSIPSGQASEADAPRSLAMSPDGRTLLVVNNTSSNVAIVDVEANEVRAYVETGRRSLEAAISVDGTRAVVTNGDEDTVTFIDLSTDTVAHTFNIPGRPAEVEIAPDGSRAYVTTVAGTDRLWFLDLDKPAISSSLPTGQMGASFYTYNVFSGIDLSADGSTLAVCVSFDDELLLVDTASESVIDRVPVGSFPLRVSFGPSASRAYVTTAFSGELYVVGVSGASSSVLGIVDGIPTPLGVDVSASGDYAYVGSWAFGFPAMHVVNTSSITSVGQVSLASSPRASVLDGDNLWVALTDGELVLIDAAGASSTLVGTTRLSDSPSDLALSTFAGQLYVAQPSVPDGLDLIATTEPFSYCIAAPNSVGPGANISTSGSSSLSANEFSLQVTGLPANVPGLFFYGAAQIQIPFGDGFRCVGSQVQRFFPLVNSNLAGDVSREIDFSAAPIGIGPQAIEVGSTWNFQLWYRDTAAGGTGFNLSDASQAFFLP